MACTLCTGVLLPVQLYFKLLVNVLMTGRLLGTKHFGGLLLIYAPPQTNLSLKQSSMLRVLFWSNAAVSRNLCAVRLVVKLSDSETTRRTARKLSVCTALYDRNTLISITSLKRYSEAQTCITRFSVWHLDAAPVQTRSSPLTSLGVILNLLFISNSRMGLEPECSKGES